MSEQAGNEAKKGGGGRPTVKLTRETMFGTTLPISYVGIWDCHSDNVDCGIFICQSHLALILIVFRPSLSPNQKSQITSDSLMVLLPISIYKKDNWWR